MSSGGAPLTAAAKKARLVSAYLRGQPVHCTWQLSPRCESFCQFCEHRSETAGDEIDADGWATVADELSRAGSFLVSLTGADPFLRADLPSIVRAVSRQHFPLLVTNGWLVTAKSARAVWEAGLEAASVALEHAEPAAHDGQTGLPGSHARAASALRALASERTLRRQRVNVRVRLRDADVSRLPALLELAAGAGATVTVEPSFPLPRADSGAPGLGRRLGELKAKHPNLRTGGPALAQMERAFAEGVPGCQAGRAFFNVDHLGRVSRCLEFQGPEDRVGALQSEPAGTLLPRLRATRAGNGCRACYYGSRAEVEALYTVRGFLGGLSELVRS